MPIFDAMVWKIKNWIALSIIPQIILVKWLGNRPEIVEEYYSEGIYPWISKFFRLLYGWVPFSVGDLLYFSLIFLTIRYVVFNWREIRNYPFRFVKNIFFVLSIAYFTFHMLWGMNYYRKPIAQKFGLSEVYEESELVDLTKKLIARTNELQFNITKDTAKMVQIPYSKKEIFDKTLIGYENMKKTYPFLDYKKPSIKKSLFSTALSYMGYGGYLNPFTHEAQVNGKLPNFRFPVVSGHEIGHQVGYSAENETNFIGYLATLYNPDVYFQYAAYSYALAYTLSDIRGTNEEKFEELYASLNPGTIFNTFLKANNQAQGIKSYNAVVSLMVGYHKEHAPK